MNSCKQMHVSQNVFEPRTINLVISVYILTKSVLLNFKEFIGEERADFPAINLCGLLFEPRCENTGFLHMQKQRRRSASR